MSNLEFRTHNSIPLRIHDQPPAGFGNSTTFPITYSTTLAPPAPVGGNSNGNPTWAATALVQKQVNLCVLYLTARAQAPFLALNPTILFLPSGFLPFTSLTFPYQTNFGQQGTLDILSTGEITNLTTVFDQINGEFFSLTAIFTC